MHGYKQLTLNGLPGAWHLDFADVSAQASFVRVPPGEGQPADQYFFKRYRLSAG